MQRVRGGRIGDTVLMADRRKPHSLLPRFWRRWRCEKGKHRLHPFGANANLVDPTTTHVGGRRCWDCGTVTWDGFPG